MSDSHLLPFAQVLHARLASSGLDLEKISPFIVYTQDAIKAAVNEIPDLDPAEFQPIFTRELMEEILAKPAFEEDYAARYKDADAYRLDDHEIAGYNEMVLGSNEWLDVLTVLDRDKARAEERTEKRRRDKMLSSIFKTMPQDLETCAVRVQTGEDPDFEAVPCPPAIIEERLLGELEMELNKSADDRSLGLIWDCLKPVLSTIHDLTWKQQQLADSLRHLTKTPSLAFESPTKKPSWVNKLPIGQRSCVGGPPVTILARALKDETPEQLACRLQRDAVLQPFEELWLDQGLTFGKLPDDVVVKICNGMYQKPSEWNWKTTKARVIDLIGRYRMDAKKKKLKMGSGGNRSSSSSSSSSTPSSSSTSSSSSKRLRTAVPAAPAEIDVFPS